MGQMATNDIHSDMSDSTVINKTFFHFSGSFISKFDKGNMTISTTNSSNELLGTEQSVQSTDVLGITDTFAKIKLWFTSVSTGVSILFGVLAGPYNFVLALGVPQWFAYAVGAMWYAITLFLIVAFIAWRNP
jgi:hypothetical protein